LPARISGAPALVRKLVINCNGWIVGSASKPEIDLATVRDIDVVIPFSYWSIAASHIPPTATPNTFGGWKIKDGEVTVDVWPDDLGLMFTSKLSYGAWHPRSDTYIQRVEV
jgi:hypothetical protein